MKTCIMVIKHHTEPTNKILDNSIEKSNLSKRHNVIYQ